VERDLQLEACDASSLSLATAMAPDSVGQFSLKSPINNCEFAERDLQLNLLLLLSVATAVNSQM